MARGVGDTAERATAEARLHAIDHGAHALPRLLDRAFVWHAVARLARHRRSQRMAARQREPCGPFEHVRVEIGGIDDARLRQGQRAGLVEHDGVDLGEALDRVAGIENDAGAKQRAGGDDLHRRDRQRQARTGR